MGFSDSSAPSPTGRWGCFNLVFIGLILLILLVGILAVIVANPGWQQTLQNFFNSQQQQQNAGPGGGIPPISNRWHNSGTASATVGGSFQFSDSIELDPVASYTQNGRSWISFIDVANPDAGEILVVFGEPENSVTVAQGPVAAIGRDDACDFDIQVTASSVSGTVSCASVEVLENFEPTGGTSSIQLSFSTVTEPMDEDGRCTGPGGVPCEGGGGGDGGEPDDTPPAD